MSSSFTTLPLEIRNEIYSHVFDYDSVMPLSHDDYKHLILYPAPQETDVCYGDDPQDLLAIFYVNHQISDEAAAYFYGKKTFRGEWNAIATFIKGIGARRRDRIRSVAIWHPDLLTSFSDIVETFELLSRLPNLRKLRVSAFVHDFTQLQNKYMRGGILELAGKIDIAVHSTYDDVMLNSSTSIKQIYNDSYVWRCATGTTQWTGGERVRKITAQFQMVNGRWHDIDDA